MDVLLAVGFIGRINTIALTITLPLLRKTGSRSRTAKVGGIWTRERSAVAQIRVFVGVVGTLSNTIADDDLPQASPVTLTTKFTLGAVPSDTVEFVRAIITVVIVVTAPPAGNAPTVVALEVRRFARRAPTIFRLIAAVILATVQITVAFPRHRNAPTRLHTPQVAVGARGRRAVSTRTLLVRPIPAVVVTITPPDVWDTMFVIALELVPRTHMHRAAFLIGTIRAVRTAVANQGCRNTMRVRSLALELRLKTGVRLAVLFVRRIVTLNGSITNLERGNAVEG